MFEDMLNKEILAIVRDFESKNKTVDEASLYPLFGINNLDSYYTATKHNRVIELQLSCVMRDKNSPLFQEASIHAICYEILCLRRQAKRSKDDDDKKQQAASSKNAVANIAALAGMVTALGAFIVTRNNKGDKNGKRKT